MVILWQLTSLAQSSFAVSLGAWLPATSYNLFGVNGAVFLLQVCPPDSSLPPEYALGSHRQQNTASGRCHHSIQMEKFLN